MSDFNVIGGTIRVKRTQHDSQQPYFMMVRSTAQDLALSPEALGILTYLLSKPDGWEVTVKDLDQREGVGRDKAYRILRELIDKRYIERTRLSDEQGHIQGYLYEVYEAPFPENPYTGNQDTYIIESIDNTESIAATETPVASLERSKNFRPNPSRKLKDTMPPKPALPHVEPDKEGKEPPTELESLVVLAFKKFFPSSKIKKIDLSKVSNVIAGTTYPTPEELWASDNVALREYLVYRVVNLKDWGQPIKNTSHFLALLFNYDLPFGWLEFRSKWTGPAGEKAATTIFDW